MGHLFFSEQLMHRLERMKDSPLSAVEAPAGYGKTTAVHKILDGYGGSIRWYTAVESMQDTSFSWFIRQVGEIDETAARKLQDLGYLNRSNADEAARIIAGIKAQEPLTLVFDNFQFAAANWQPQILNSLAKRPDDGFRTIFITQNFGRLRDVLTAMEDSICYVSGRDLLLTEEDIASYAAQNGIGVTPGQVREIRERTAGWAAAVRLYLETLREEDVPVQISDMEDLLMELFWRRLTDGQKEIMLRLCLEDHLTRTDIDGLLEDTGLDREEANQLLIRAPLVRYREVRRDFFPHEILLTFLRGRLEDSDPEFRNDVYCRFGRLFRDKGMTKPAVGCFYKAKDFEGILTCSLICLITETFDGVSYTQIARDTLSACPDDVLKKYPLSLLRLCYALYAGCSFDEFNEQMERVKAVFEEMDDPHLIGEWYLMSAFSDFPDLEAMGRKYEAAEELLEHPSDVFIKEEPFMFGCASMWYMFYSEPGEMLATADRFEKVMAVYNRLTNGHGAGAAEIYRGEALSVRGNFEESDIQAYQAAFLSEQSGCATATYGAALLLGINAIYRSDMVGLQKAVDYLENKATGYSFLQGKMLNTYMVETVRGYLLGLMMETGRSALWTQGEADSLSDLTFTNFMIKTCRITDLLLKKEYKRAIASVEASLNLDPRLITTATKNFMYCGLALGYLAIGRLIRASEYLDKSLSIAYQDKNYTFLACFRKYFQVLFLMPKIASKHADAIREIKALKIRYTRADESHIFEMIDEVPEMDEPLTEREREVASLAAEGMHNPEIAKRLFISENTVKQHLKSAFRKMNIDRRRKLIEMLR